MASPSDLSFDCKPHVKFDESHKFEELLARLEEERHKIEAFKRELPLCMQLITNAMETSRQQLQRAKPPPVLEEFIPLKKASDSSETDGSLSADRTHNWMTSVQLWNQETDGVKTAPPLRVSPQEADITFTLNGSQRINGGGAFHPFSSKDKASSYEPEGLPELALASSHAEDVQAVENKNSGKCSGGDREQVCGSGGGSSTQRKARRCWSPDLHRRFVKALQILGGSQVATPKQIRELMKVDGLTNDEVKSHLQKYRLHTRRPSPTPQAAVAAPPQVVVLGGIWVPPEYAAAAAAQGGGGPAAAAALYGGHAAPPHHMAQPFCSSNAQEMYNAIAKPQPSGGNQLRHPHHHGAAHQRHYSRPPRTQRNSSPESDVQGGGGGNPSESIEDGKSESSSWKADSGERRRAEAGEDSNASIVSLKF